MKSSERFCDTLSASQLYSQSHLAVRRAHHGLQFMSLVFLVFGVDGGARHLLDIGASVTESDIEWMSLIKFVVLLRSIRDEKYVNKRYHFYGTHSDCKGCT